MVIELSRSHFQLQPGEGNKPNMLPASTDSKALSKLHVIFRQGSNYKGQPYVSWGASQISFDVTCE